MAHFDSIPGGKLGDAIRKALREDEAVRHNESARRPPVPKPEKRYRSRTQINPLYLHVPCVPWSLNAERTMHWSEHGERTKAVRSIISLLLRPNTGTYRSPVVIEVTPVGVRHDAANTMPTAKAAIDGLVDAGVLIDDDKRYVSRIIFNAPVPSMPKFKTGLVLCVYLSAEHDLTTNDGIR